MGCNTTRGQQEAVAIEIYKIQILLRICTVLYIFIHTEFKQKYLVILSILTGDNVAFNALLTAVATACEMVLERVSRSVAIFT